MTAEELEKRIEELRGQFAKGFVFGPRHAPLKLAAEALGNAFGAELVLVSRIKREDKLVEAYGLFDSRQRLECYAYHLSETPCELVYKTRRPVSFLNGLQQRFPRDIDLQTFDLRAYVGVPLIDSAGECLGLCCCLWSHEIDDARAFESVLAEVSGFLTMQMRREEEQQIYRLSDAGSAAGLWFIDLELGEISLTPRTQAILGCAEARLAVEAHGLFPWLDAADRDRAQTAFRHHLDEEEKFDLIFSRSAEGGPARWFRQAGRVHRNAQGKPTGFGGSIADITELMQTRERALHLVTELESARRSAEMQALTDPLTQLPNRRHADQKVKEIEASAHEDAVVALMHIDLDDFKRVNDTFGHAAGDFVLEHVARTMRATFRPNDFVARIGGDEFVVLLLGATSADLAERAQEVVTRIAEPIIHDNHVYRIAASIGVACSPANEASQLLSRADQALYVSKATGRGRVTPFSPELEQKYEMRKTIAKELLVALEKDQLTPFFQPQFDARTGELAGVEALVRWLHPERGVLAPGNFFDVAADMNLMHKIDEVVFAKSVAVLSRLIANGARIPRLSVNACYDRLCSSSCEILPPAEARGFKIAIELHETIFFDDKESKVFSHLERLRAGGVQIEIDDFGSGHASIVGLLRTAPDGLKIDRQLIGPMLDSKARRKLVKSIIDIGRSLGISVAAEGVETLDHASVLRAMGCDVLQGFAFAHPMPATDLDSFIREHAWPRVD